VLVGYPRDSGNGEFTAAIDSQRSESIFVIGHPEDEVHLTPELFREWKTSTLQIPAGDPGNSGVRCMTSQGNCWDSELYAGQELPAKCGEPEIIADGAGVLEGKWLEFAKDGRSAWKRNLKALMAQQNKTKK